MLGVQHGPLRDPQGEESRGVWNRSDNFKTRSLALHVSSVHLLY